MTIDEEILDLKRKFSELRQAWQLVHDYHLELKEAVTQSTTKNTENAEIIRKATAELKDFLKSTNERFEKLEVATGLKKVGPLFSQTREGEA